MSRPQSAVFLLLKKLHGFHSTSLTCWADVVDMKPMININIYETDGDQAFIWRNFFLYTIERVSQVMLYLK